MPLDGCATFRELLDQTLRGIKEALDARAAAEPPGGDPRVLARKAWQMAGEEPFNELVRRLREHGFEGGTRLEAGRYEARDAVDLRGGDFRAGSFRGALLENAHFQGADLRGVCFAGARCFETRFQHARCDGASFEAAECQFADFRWASCARAAFAGADCSMARFEGARLGQGDFRAATCFATGFDGAFLHNAAISAMRINHYTRFGKPGEQREAELSRKPRTRDLDEEDWFIAHLNPHWLRAAQVNAEIRGLLRANGDFMEADKYQYHEMVCRRHLQVGNPLGTFFQWFFKDRIFGYGLKWHRPLITIVIMVAVWTTAFCAYFHATRGTPLAQSLGDGFYYSVICLTTLGLGNLSDIVGFWGKFLVCSEALIGSVLMPIFLMAYARKILQD